MAAETTNINSACRDMWEKTVVSQVFMKNPLVVRMMAQKRVWVGGKQLAFPIDVATFEDVAQSYGYNDVLTNQDVEYLKAPKFDWKLFQVPVQYSIEEELKNDGPDAILDLVGSKVEKAQEGARLKMRAMMYDPDNTEAGTAFESICLALDHSRTYGGLTTATTTTYPLWNGASLAGTYADRATAITPSLSNFRKLLACCQRRMQAPPGEWLAITSDTIFQSLQEDAARFRVYTTDGSLLYKHGFNAMVLDGCEVVSDSYLEITPSTGAINSTRQKYFFLLHIPSWELKFHPRRAFRFTGFKWQGDQVNGKDFKLGRILNAGNLVTRKPNASIWRSNMS
ncbi:MAG TPA: phage major capsid protein [Phycisphaerae bacterium]|nr:phage major capsid protein [Phycisphaerae bacterium]